MKNPFTLARQAQDHVMMRIMLLTGGVRDRIQLLNEFPGDKFFMYGRRLVLGDDYYVYHVGKVRFLLVRNRR